MRTFFCFSFHLRRISVFGRAAEKKKRRITGQELSFSDTEPVLIANCNLFLIFFLPNDLGSSEDYVVVVFTVTALNIKIALQLRAS